METKESSQELLDWGGPREQSPKKIVRMSQVDQDGFLDVGGQHSIYYTTVGPVDGIPVAIVHGGPGGSMTLKWGEVFDTERFRLIFFDQRGCGKSTPPGDCENNTLALVVEDMEALRTRLGVDKWLLYGGSWGTTVALAYGVRFPERCLGFLLRGIFLARTEDMEFFLWTTRRIYPEAHAAFCETIARATGGEAPSDYASLIALVGKGLRNGDNEKASAVAKAWGAYENLISAVYPITTNEDPVPDSESDQLLINLGKLEHHFFANVLPPYPPLLESIAQTPALTALPCWIVHGRLDLVCPSTQAVELKKVWPSAQLFVNDGAGHWTFERPNREKLYECAAAIEAHFAQNRV